MITELLAIAGVAAALTHKGSKDNRKSYHNSNSNNYHHSNKRSYDSDNDRSYRRPRRSYTSTTRSEYDDALAWQHDHSDLGI